MKKWKRMLAMLMTTAMMIGSMTVSAFADASVDAMYQDTLSIIEATVTDDIDSANAEKIMTTARAGVLSEAKADAYYNKLKNELDTLGNSTLPYTDNIKNIWAVTAIGKDATDVGGYNLLDPLADMSYCTTYVTTGACALIAIDSNNYTIPTVAAGGTQTTREALIQYILDERNSSGVWGSTWSGIDYFIDDTAMVIQALTPYYASNPTVKAAVDDGIAYLSSAQDSNGGYGGNVSSEAQVLVALTGLGINPVSDARFVKNGKTILDSMSINYVAGQGFMYYGAIDLNFSTPQATYALVANNRFENGKNSLFDMTSETPPAQVTTTEATTTEATTTEATTTAAKKDSTPTTGDSMPVAALVSIAIVAVGGAIVTTRKKQIK